MTAGLIFTASMTCTGGSRQAAQTEAAPRPNRGEVLEGPNIAPELQKPSPKEITVNLLHTFI